MFGDCGNGYTALDSVKGRMALVSDSISNRVRDRHIFPNSGLYKKTTRAYCPRFLVQRSQGRYGTMAGMLERLVWTSELGEGFLTGALHSKISSFNKR